MTLGTMPLAEMLVDHVAELALVDALTVTPWRELSTPAQEHIRAERQRDATLHALAILAREHSGESERAPFAGPLQALRALADWRLDGAAVPGTSVWARLLSDGSSSTERPSSTVERLADVALHWEATLSDGWTLSTYPVRYGLSAPEARAVALCAVLGCPGTFLPRQDPVALSGEGVRPALAREHVPLRLRALGRPLGGGQVDRFSDPSPSEVAEFVLEATGITVPVGHVVRLRAVAVGEFYRRMVGCGLVPRSGRLESMTASDERAWDCEGWEEVRAVIGRDPKVLREWAARDDDPLPVSDVGGRVCAVKSELLAWGKREFERGRRRGAARP